MRKLLLSIFLLMVAVAFAGSAQPDGRESDTALPKTDSVAAIKFDSTAVWIGEFEADSVRYGSFGFTNTGTAPLVVKSVFSDCGCTAASYSREPVAPGERGEIKVKFYDKNRRPGDFMKRVKVRTNTTPASTYLYIRGKILPTW